MNQIKKTLIKLLPKKRYYIGICGYIVVISFIQKSWPIYQRINFYTYEYGLMNPWVEIYNREPLGSKGLVDMIKCSNMGISWYPGAILIDAFMIFMVITIIKYFYIKTKKHYHLVNKKVI